MVVAGTSSPAVGVLWWRERVWGGCPCLCLTGAGLPLHCPNGPSRHSWLALVLHRAGESGVSGSHYSASEWVPCPLLSPFNPPHPPPPPSPAPLDQLNHSQLRRARTRGGRRGRGGQEQGGGAGAQSATSTIDSSLWARVFILAGNTHIHSQQENLPPNGELPCSVRGKSVSQEQEMKE